MGIQLGDEHRDELKQYIIDVLGRSEQEADALVANALEAEREAEAELEDLDAKVDRLFAEPPSPTKSGR